MNKVATFQERFIYALNIRGIKQADVANYLHLTRGIIHHYYNGECEPKMDRLKQIADYLNVDISWLMGLDVPMDSETEHHYQLREKIKDAITYAPDEILEKVLTYINDIYHK